MKTPAALAATLAALLLTGTLHAQVPGLINYQSRVAVGGINFDGTGAFKFALVNALGNTAYWTNDNTHLDGTEPNAAVSLPVVKGLYSVLLGDGTLLNMQPVPSTVFAHADVRLRVWFNDGIHGSQLLTPDQRIAATGYAMIAATATTVYGDGSAGDYTAPPSVSTLVVSNPQFKSFNVQAGSTLHVPSGLTIRCATTFTNLGQIVVDPTGGIIQSNYSESLIYSSSQLHLGIAKSAPFNNFAGTAFPPSQLQTIFSVGLTGGGTSSSGSLGGGAFRVLARGELVNYGTISAIGNDGYGGGGGGIVILASASSLLQTGVIDASGGNVGPGAVEGTAGGGGGMIRLLAPSLNASGQNRVLGGLTRADSSNGRIYYGGGASAGNGGGVVAGAIVDGAQGLVLKDQCDPTALLGN